MTDNELFGNSEQLDDSISRQAAIEAICEDGTQLERQGQYTMTMVERKQRDVDILEELPSATDTNVATTDTISRNAAFDALNEIKIAKGANWYEFYQKALTAVGNLPSAQPDIVACADCIHWICHDRRCGYWNHGVKPLDWCCHAERRSDG